MKIKPYNMKFLNRVRELYRKFIYNFSEKDEELEAYSTLEQSKVIANKVIWIITSTTGISILFLVFAKTDQIIIAQGDLQPTDRVREIKIPISGVVEKIMIEEGDYVKENRELFILDDYLAKETYQNLNKKIKLKANELFIKEEELGESIKKMKSEIINLKEIMKIENRHLNKFETLFTAGAISKYDYENQKIKLIKYKSELNNKQLLLNEKEYQIKQQIKLIENNILDFKNQLEIVKEKLKYSIIYSPISGYVFELKAKDSGYVINPNIELMKIVPENNLEAVIYIESSDIGFVDLGRKVELNIDSYPSSDFGILNGSISFVSPSSSKINSTNDGLFFRAKVELENQNLISASGQKLNLKPGMSLRANIKLRKLSYLQLIFSLFTDKAKSIKQI